MQSIERCTFLAFCCLIFVKNLNYNYRSIKIQKSNVKFIRLELEDFEKSISRDAILILHLYYLGQGKNENFFNLPANLLGIFNLLKQERS